MGFWSRFTATFDFPGKRVFLAKGDRYGQADRGDYGGLVLARKGDIIVVDAVLRDSPAMEAGLREGDVVLRVDDSTANEMELPASVCCWTKPGEGNFQSTAAFWISR